MSDTPKDQDEELTEEEAAKRRDEVLKKMLNTPPKPHKSTHKTTSGGKVLPNGKQGKTT